MPIIMIRLVVLIILVIRLIERGIILLTICGIVANMIIIIPILGWILGGLLDIVILVFWVLSLIAAIKGEKYTLPIIGDKITLIK